MPDVTPRHATIDLYEVKTRILVQLQMLQMLSCTVNKLN